MERHRSVLVGAVLLIATLGFAAAAGRASTPAEKKPMPPASHWISQNAIMVIELTRPKALLDILASERLVAAIGSHPGFQTIASRPETVKGLQMVKLLETKLNTDWRTGLSKLAGGGITLAVNPNGNLLIVDAEDAEMLEQLHQTVLGLVKIDAASKNQPDRATSREHQGIPVWTLAPEEEHALIGTRLLTSNRREAMDAALDLRAAGGGQDRSLAGFATYREAMKAVGSGLAGSIFVNLELIKQNPQVQEGLTNSQNALGALLFAGITDAIKGSRWLAMGMRVEGSTLSLRAVVDGATATSSGLAGFTWPSSPDEGALENIGIPRRIAAMSLYRDLPKFYNAKDQLFPDRTSGLIFFENMMGIFFTGRNFADEVLAHMRPETRLVVAEQAYDPAIGTPQVQLPAFAAIFRMRDPDKFMIVVEEAWQKGLGLINFTRGQNAEPGLLIDRPIHNGVKYTISAFAPPSESEKSAVPSRFNFSPAVARVGDYLVMSSTDGLARDLIDALQKEGASPAKAIKGINTVLELDGRQLNSILSANRENLIQQNMINEGRTRDDAEAAMDLFLCVLKSFDGAKFALGSTDGRPEASLEVRLTSP
jgi:hypothetical protein